MISLDIYHDYSANTQTGTHLVVYDNTQNIVYKSVKLGVPRFEKLLNLINLTIH